MYQLQEQFKLSEKYFILASQDLYPCVTEYLVKSDQSKTPAWGTKLNRSTI